MFIELTILGFGHRPRPFNPDARHKRMVNMDRFLSFGRDGEATGMVLYNLDPWWVEETPEEIVAKMKQESK